MTSTPTTSSRDQRLRWSLLFLAGAFVVLITSVTQNWYRFSFAGNVQVQPGVPVVDVSASATLSATEAAAVAGATWFGLPIPVVLLAMALALGAVAVRTRLWVTAAAGLALVLPAANGQLGALTARVEHGPGGHLLSRGPGLELFAVAFFAAAAALVVVTVTARAARQAQLAVEREALVAAGQEVPPTLGDLVRGAVQARLRLPGPPRPTSQP
jgi:hypothetical protein